MPPVPQEQRARGVSAQRCPAPPGGRRQGGGCFPSSEGACSHPGPGLLWAAARWGGEGASRLLLSLGSVRADRPGQVSLECGPRHLAGMPPPAAPLARHRSQAAGEVGAGGMADPLRASHLQRGWHGGWAVLGTSSALCIPGPYPLAARTTRQCEHPNDSRPCQLPRGFGDARKGVPP